MTRIYDSARRAELIVIINGRPWEERSIVVKPMEVAVIRGLYASVSLATRLLLPCEMVHPFYILSASLK